MVLEEKSRKKVSVWTEGQCKRTLYGISKRGSLEEGIINCCRCKRELTVIDWMGKDYLNTYLHDVWSDNNK